MKKLILIARSLAAGQFFLPALALALIGNVLMTHQAHATFFAPRGKTQIIAGTDRLTGQVASPGSPLSLLYIYPNDTGSAPAWRASVWNSGDLQGGTDVTVKYKPFSSSTPKPNTDANTSIVNQHVEFANQLQYEIDIVTCTTVSITPIIGPTLANAKCPYYYLDYTQNATWDPAAISATSDVPGSQFCEYVVVNPAGATYIPGWGASAWNPSLPPLPPNVDYRNSAFIPGQTVGSNGSPGPSAPNSVMACKQVAYNYNLTPIVDSVTSASGTDTVTFII